MGELGPRCAPPRTPSPQPCHRHLARAPCRSWDLPWGLSTQPGCHPLGKGSQKKGSEPWAPRVSPKALSTSSGCGLVTLKPRDRVLAGGSRSSCATKPSSFLRAEVALPCWALQDRSSHPVPAAPVKQLRQPQLSAPSSTQRLRAPGHPDAASSELLLRAPAGSWRDQPGQLRLPWRTGQ